MIFLKGFFYRLLMRMAHKYNWHYAPPVYPDGDTQLWCKWCGFRQTIKHADHKDLKYLSKEAAQKTLRGKGKSKAAKTKAGSAL